MLAAVALLTWTKQFLFLAIIVGVLLFTLMQVYLFPILCSRFERVKTELPDENDDLKQQIKDFCVKVNFANDAIFMIHDLSGDLHSNAELAGKEILLADILLEHHKGHNDEIMAIVAHEIGHYKWKHL